ncbi:hypothetical protein SAMN05421829_1144 [Aromatoleum tolulyticum]|uniref:Uncharacterized protein n=1 Tax=Aromatoleum tolulyticum TaxID=34027 RepID=A0A1N7ADQ2_9RHOO|nr:hypothetical protein [Aromatoleum tolulyticum]SIR37186.1 hypothetical protein SAMN05421829_1144 [Aromatoleum tolulyticum]
MTTANELSGLYYPFSRPIDLASLKQMLLVFDSVAFLDPVDDDSWRAKLFEGLERQEDKRFAAYQKVHDNLRLLFQEGAARRIDPVNVAAIENPVTTASALSDLLDDSWTRVASNPGRFGMPHRCLRGDGSATWQIFLPKMPGRFVESLCSDDSLLRGHLVQQGDELSSWTLSYEAGSAVSISVHLSAAEELGLSPVTDSAMHHELLIRKLIRNREYPNERSRPIDEKIVMQLTHSTVAALIDELVPRELLETMDMEQILRFREQTSPLRKQAMGEMGNRLRILSKVPSTDDFLVASYEVQQQIRTDLRGYRAELAATRDKLWPTLVGSMNSNIAAGSVAAVAMNFIGGPGYALAASILAGSLALLKGTLDLRLERTKLEASRSPAVTYLARVQSLR